MHPVLTIAPVYVFARIARLAGDAERIRRFVATALVVAFCVLGIRAVSYSEIALDLGMRRSAVVPYEALADALREQLAAGGTIVAIDARDGGNLRAFLPHVRIKALDSLRVLPVARRAGDERSCLLLWKRGDRKQMRKLGIEPAGERLDVVSPASFLRGPVSGTWFLVRLDPADQLCR
jgi:hypothetical protein